MRIVSTLLVVVALWLAGGVATAADTLRVGVIQASPFASQVDGDYQGLVIDLWEKVAADNHWAFDYLSAGTNVDQAIQQLYADRFDILIGPISVNRARLAKVDFSRPFFINNIGVIIPKHSGHFFDAFDASLSQSFGLMAIALILAFIIYLHLFWYFERGKHPEISESYWQAIGNGLWAHMIKRGFGSMPTTLYGKFTLLFWLVCVGMLFTSFNAAVTSTFTVALAKQYDSIRNFGDLQQLQLVGVKGIAASSLARNQGLSLTDVDNLPEAFTLLEKAKVGGIVYDAVIAQNYLASQHLTSFMLSHFMLGQEEYAFAMPYHSPLAQPINMAIVELQDNQQVSLMCQKYLGAQAQYCQL